MQKVLTQKEIDTLIEALSSVNQGGKASSTIGAQWVLSQTEIDELVEALNAARSLEEIHTFAAERSGKQVVFSSGEELDAVIRTLNQGKSVPADQLIDAVNKTIGEAKCSSEWRNNEKVQEEIAARAKEIVSQMTLEEKVSQTLNWSPAIERLGIPAYNWWNEALHGIARAGVATVFPQAITMACSFDENLIEQVADVISTEGRAKFNMQQKYGDEDIYKGLTFWSPNVNIFRDPRWGRGHETFGEDPYLTSRLGVRFIEGMQGHDKKYMKVAACAKHFAVHSGPEDVRHEFNAEVSMQDLYETYLPAFEACVKEAGVEAVMGAYNRTNGEPCNGSKMLLQDILRGKWGFKGHVVSDCWAIKDFHEGHHVTEDAVHSVALAANMGCDVNCGNLFKVLGECVKSGLVSEERLDEMVETLIRTRLKLGMKVGKYGEDYDNPYNDIKYSACDSDENRDFNRRVAEQCAVLLKNDKKLLPLNLDRIETIGVIGPNADNRRALVGNYEGTSSEYVTILDGIREYAEKYHKRIMYSQGCHLCNDKVEGLGQPGDRDAEVMAVCDASDVVICVMGLDSGLEGEEGDQGNQYASGDKPDLNLPGRQEEILKLAASSDKPVVLVLLGGSALAINRADKEIPAILYGGYPGAQGGRAIANLLFGAASPEGKLPITFYRSSEELPDFKDYSMKGRTYRYMKNEPLYPFGYGLSYTRFEVGEVKVSKDKADAEGLRVSAEITNTGDVAGGETLQVYVKAEKDGAPNAQLKGFRKVYLKPGEARHIEIDLPGSAFMLADENGEMKMDAPEYRIYIGTCQPDKRSRELTGTEPVEITIKG